MRERKRILFVITKANWGGAQKYVYDIATALPVEEFEVAVAFGKSGLLAEKLKAASIPTYSIDSLGRDVAAFADFKSFMALYKLFRKVRPDIVHLNSSKAGGLGALAARLAGVPLIVFTAHGWPFWEPRGAISRGLIYFFSWITALLSHRIIVVSNYDLEVAERMPFVSGKTIRIYNGIPSHLSFGSGEVIRKAFPLGVRIAGTVGELTKNKNQIALIERARNDPKLYVAIVGEGEDRTYLEKNIAEYGLQDRVKLFGFMPPQDVLRGFDVFMLPSLKEGVPYVLMEAKAAGLPIEANRVGGVSEILDGNHDFSLERMLQETTAVYRSH